MRGKWHDEANRALWASGTEKKNKAAVSVRRQKLHQLFEWGEFRET